MSKLTNFISDQGIVQEKDIIGNIFIISSYIMMIVLVVLGFLSIVNL